MNAVGVGYDGKPVLRDLSLRLDADDRIALLGANGNGKSTLIKLLAGRLEPLSGDVIKSGKLRVGYFAQHQADELDLEATPFVELARRRPRDLPVAIRKQLGRFGFTQQRADTTIANLSGGEKARLLFALMTSARPHILLLDEPANHLDIDSRQALIQAINAYEGAVVIVSHDPHVIELTTDRFWLVDGGAVKPFDGDMDDYRALLMNGGVGGNGNAGTKPADADASPADRKQQRREAAERRNALAPLRKTLTAAETRVAKLEAEKAHLVERMADPMLYEGDNRKVIELRRLLGQVEKDLESAEQLWIDAQEAWDGAQAESS
jgi:ATP-binding cassette subfamily F protein 3